MGSGSDSCLQSLLRHAGAGLVVAVVLLTAPPAGAQSGPPHTELFSGFEATDNSASGYVGAGYAFGKGLYESGWRLRGIGSFGRYNYDGTLAAGVNTNFDGEDTFGAALIGYQWRENHLFVKLFAGIEAEDQSVSPHDPHNSVQGSELGLKLVEETWFDLSSRSFFSFDASYGTAFQEYASLARIGYRLTPAFSLGLEGGALGNQEYDAGKGGGFLRLDVLDLEVTLSGGFTGNYLDDQPSGYVSLGVYRAF